MVFIPFIYITEFTEPSKIHEQVFVGYLWNTPQLYEKFRSHKLTVGTFVDPTWWFYYRLGKEMYDNGMRTFDDVTVYSFLTSRPKETGKKSWFDYYNEYGGYAVVEEVIQECSRDKANEEYHLSEIQKYETLRLFQRESMIDVNNKELILKLGKMTLKQLQMFFQLKHKMAFAHVNAGEVVEHNLIDDLEGTIDRLDKGEALGLAFHDSPRLNKKIKGWKNGNLMYLVLASGVGKTSFGTEKALLSMIENDEKGLVFANEQGVFHFRTLLLATVASKILNKPINREKLSQGNFNEETKNRLNAAKDWLYEHRRDMIKFCEMKKYRIEDVISRIELYRPLGYTKIFFDTFKPDRTGRESSRWEAFSDSAQELHDCIKEDANNCATLATVQLKLGKEYRYLDMSVIGKSLEIVEVAGVVLIGRMLYTDEYPEGKHALKPYNWKQDELTKDWYRHPYELDPEKQYLILFLSKNRFGSIDEQIVYEANYSINSWKEVAYVMVPRTSNAIA